MALTKLEFDSSAIPKEQSSANVIVEMPGNVDEAPSRTCRDDPLGFKTLDEATRTVRDLVAGRSQEIEIVSSTDKNIRKAVAAELLASLSRPNIEEREHARRLFVDHGYLDDAMQELGTAGLPNERAMAARALGLIASPRGIMSLVNALLDDAPEVRHASEQALAQISGPVVADLGALLEEELNLEAAEVVESYSTPTTMAFQETPFQNLTIEERMVEKPMSEATEVRASTICLDEEAVQKAMQELKHRLLEAEDLTRKRNEFVQKAMQELEHRLLEAEELTRKRIELEAPQRVEVHAARCAEAEQALRELEEQREKELALLHSEVDEFQQALEVLAQQRAGVEEVRLETAAQIRRFDEEKAELEAAVEARKAEAERLRIEAERQLSKAENRSRAEVEEVRLETAAQIRRFDEEKAELEAAVEASKAEAERLRIEAERQLSEVENRSRAEQEQFLLQTAHLERVTEEVAHRRAEVEASLHKANEEDRQLLEIQQATEQSRQPASVELLWLEPEICQRTYIDQGLREETRQRAQDQQQLIEEEARRRAEVEEQRLAELAHERAERERQLINEVNNLQFAEVEGRKQIEQAEHLRDEAQEHNSYAMEELERISSDAQGQAIQEEQMLSKLEDIRRQLVVATQAQLADLPDEEVEKLRSLEWEQEELAEKRKSVGVS